MSGFSRTVSDYVEEDHRCHDDSWDCRLRARATPRTLLACRPPPAAAAAERPYLLERVDEAAVVQVYADGFQALPLKEKTLIWHLYQAALAGRDIFYDQKYAPNLEMRDVLEAIITHPADDR